MNGDQTTGPVTAVFEFVQKAAEIIRRARVSSLSPDNLDLLSVLRDGKAPFWEFRGTNANLLRLQKMISLTVLCALS